MNTVILSGRLTRDPEIRHTPSGIEVARYTLAVDRPGAKQEPKADFIICTAWDKKAEFAEKYMRKGRKFVVEGRIQTRSYKDKDGKTVYTTEVVVNNQEFADSADSKPEGSAPVTAQPDEFVTIPEDLAEELPFR